MENIQNKIQDHGFNPKLEIEDPKAYMLGEAIFGKRLPAIVIRPDGNWTKFLPVRELQRKYGLETMNCTNYGTHNALETLHKALYGTEPNYSERYSGVCTGTSRGGNSAHGVIEKIRKYYGCIPEDKLPFTSNIDTWSEYYSPKPMTQNYLNIGKQWLKDYELGHEWVIVDNSTNKAQRLMEGLKYSPLGISVRAWKYRNGMYWKNPNEPDNHWVCLYGYEKNNCWWIYDSYDNTKKRLEWNYNFMFAKRYYLKKLTAPQPNPSEENDEVNNMYLITPYGNQKDKPVYEIKKNSKYWITDEPVAKEHDWFGFKDRDDFWANVKPVEDKVLNRYKTKIKGDFKISFILKRIFGGLTTIKGRE